MLRGIKTSLSGVFMPTEAACRSSIAPWVRRSALLQIASVAFGYLLSARFAHLYAEPDSGRLVLWLPNAVVLSALLLTHRREWWKYGLTLVLSQLLVDRRGLPEALLSGLLNWLEVLLAGYGLRRWCGRDFAFASVRELVWFAGLAMGLAPGLATALGAALHYGAAGQATAFVQLWQNWWISHGMGMVVLTPLLFGWLHVPTDTPHPAATGWSERVAFAVLLTWLVYLVFVAMPDPHRSWVSGPMLLLPLFLWAALRFGTLGVSLVGCLVSLLAIVLTSQGRGMLSLLDAGLKTQLLQQYLAALLLTGLAVAAILNELRLKVQSLRLFKLAIDNMGEGLAIADARQPDLPIVYCNAKFLAITGYSSAEILGRNCRFLNTANREQPQLQAVRQQLEQGHPFSTTLENYRKDGQPFWNQLTITPVRGSDGRLTHVIGIQRDVTEIRLVQQNLLDAHAALTALNHELEQRVARRTAALEHLATTDPLTDAHNRRFLMDRAEIEIALARRQSHGLSLVMFDIDHFKRINDSHGHSVGDQVLVTLSRAVQGEMRAGDTFARIGGEEFVMLLPRADAAQALRVAERLRVLIASLEIGTVKGDTLRITSSFGVASLAPQVNSVDALYVASDTALYQAKEAGRNRVVAYQPAAYSS
jgi:diguanylate cyclase (GGDEF)-like protein/PAS domain S-box-containing protein